MRHHAPRWTAALLVLLLALAPVAADNGAIALGYPATTLTLDGDLGDWPADRLRYPATLVGQGWPLADSTDCQVHFSAAWDPGAQALWVGVEVQDTSTVVTPATPRLTARDGCEVYLSLATGDGSPPVVQHVIYGDDAQRYGRVQRQGGRHCYEWCLDRTAWPTGAAPLRAGAVLGFDLAVCDQDADGTYSWVSFGPGAGKYAQADRLGELLLLPSDASLSTLAATLSWRDHPGGVPLARLLLRQHATGAVLTARTDPGGHLEVRLPSGAYSAQLATGERQAPPRALHLRPGRREQLTWTLDPSPGQRRALGGGHGWWTPLGPEDGFAGAYVKALLQDIRGTVWLAVDHGGVFRYDGSGFVACPAAGRARAMTEGPPGTVWLGGPGGLVRFDGTHWQELGPSSGAPEGITALAGDAAGTLWIGTQRGLIRFDGQAFAPVAATGSIAAQQLFRVFVDSRGRCWLGGPFGASVLDGGRATTFTTENGLLFNGVTALGQDAAGHVWLGTGHGACRMDGDGLTHFTTAQGLPDNRVWCMASDARGRLWVGTNQGVAWYDGQRFVCPGVRDGLPDGPVFAALADTSGRLWLGTQGGVVRGEGSRLTTFTTADGLPHDRIQALAEDREGALWIGTFGGGVCRLQGDRLTTFTTADGLPDDRVWAMAMDAGGRLWLGTNAGPCVYDGHHLQPYDATSGIVPGRVLDIACDAAGSVWLATGTGVYVYRDERFVRLPAPRGPSERAIHSLAAGPDGQLWAGSAGAVLRLNATGTALESAFTVDPLAPVTALTADAAGPRWVGTRNGLFLREADELRPVSLYDGAGAPHAAALLRDHRGHLWVGTQGGGVSRYDGSVFQHLRRQDGLAHDAVNALLESSNGEVWIGTQAGLTRVRPARGSPPVQLLEVVTDRHRPPVGVISMAQAQRLVVFRFAGAGLGWHPDRALFAYQLLGHDPHLRFTRQGQAEYTGLPPGRYTFQVQAIDADLNYSAAPAVVGLRVRPSYERLAWVGTVLLAAGLLTWQTSRLLRRDLWLRRANQQLQQQAAELAHANRRLQDTQAQLIQAEKMTTLGMLAGGVAHELNNPLQALLDCSRRMLRFPDDLERHRQSATIIEQAAQRCTTIIQSLLDYARRAGPEPAMVDLGEALRSTMTLLHHQLERAGVQVEVHAQGAAVVAGSFGELCTVITNLLVNARDAVCGARPADARRITVTVTGTAGAVRLSVADNGPGVPPEIRSRVFDPFFTTKPVGQGTGLGLAIVAAIVERHGGRVEVGSEPGQGACFTVHLPAASSSR